jgi:UDP-N-acetyl-D-mannosaminuronic acid transferase (WecB/TagA/CpsF family)
VSDAKAFKAIDHDFREGLRSRIKAADLVDRLQNHVMNAAAYPMTQTQLKAALGLLGHVLPQLKAVEHTNAPTRTETREELIERIAKLHAGAVAVAQRGTANGAVAADGTAEVRH